MATSMTEELDRELEDREPPATRTPPGTAPPRTARTATYRVLCGTRLKRTVYVPVPPLTTRVGSRGGSAASRPARSRSGRNRRRRIGASPRSRRAEGMQVRLHRRQRFLETRMPVQRIQVGVVLDPLLVRI